MRIVLLAEGGGEASGLSGLRKGPKAPGTALDSEELGAGHWLIQRVLEDRCRIPENAVRFEMPLRTKHGRQARGSDLINPRILRQLLTPLQAELVPNLFVILVDQDGKRDRGKQLADWTQTITTTPKVIGVAIKEFEAWLIADVKTVRNISGSSIQVDKNPEDLPCRQAKDKLTKCLGSSDNKKQLRINIARECNIELLESQCSAFLAFSKDLQKALS